MSMRSSFFVLLEMWICCGPIATEPWKEERRTFTASEDGFFELDGNRFHIYAGEIHYFRVARCKWQDRLRKLKRVGLNSVSTSVEWATHEPSPGKYLWTGNADVFKFIDLAYELDLLVVIRAGPFIDADRDFGGMPRWLLSTNLSKSENPVRDYSPEYRYHAKKWLDTLLPKIREKTVMNGGPVIMVQIDSDLGENAFCGSHEWMYGAFASQLGPDTLLFTMDRNLQENIFCGRIDGTVPGFRTNPLEYAVSFNASAKQLFAAVEENSGNFPKLVELRSGMARSWGGRRFSYDESEFEKAFADLLDYNSSVILYMFAGGTNFERAGCSGSEEAVEMMTSYDYDAMVKESGDLTERYFKSRSILIERGKFAHAEDELSELRLEQHGKRALYESPNFGYLGSLLDPEVRKDLEVFPVNSMDPLPFHAIDAIPAVVEMVLYECLVPRNFSARRSSVEIHSLGIRDRGYVYIGRQAIGIMNNARHTITTGYPVTPGQRIQILVENQGHGTRPILADRKGILSPVYLDSMILRDWTMWAFAFDEIEGLQRRIPKLLATPRRRPAGKQGVSLYQANFVASPVANHDGALDSFLDVSQLGKGQVFLNEHSVGKYWSRQGPQQALYVPACFVKPYPFTNQLVVVELQRQAKSKPSANGTFRLERFEKKYLSPNPGHSARPLILLLIANFLISSTNHLYIPSDSKRFIE